MESKFSIKSTGHTYITLYWEDKRILSMDNDCEYAESIIERIERRTGMKITDIPIKGSVDDFSGFRFWGKSGWHNLITGE